MKLWHPACKINSQHDSNSLSIKNLQQCPVCLVPSPLFFALAFSDFHQHIRNELYEFSLFKENQWPRKGSKRGSSYVCTHVGCDTYLFMINPHFQFRFACPGGGGGTPIHCLYGYVPPNGVVILKLLIQNGVSISDAFSKTGYKKLWIAALSSA